MIVDSRRLKVAESGQSLIEIIVAVGLIVATVTALLALAVMSLKTSGYGLMKARAVKVGNAMLEKARANRETMDWSTFTGSSDSMSLEGIDGSYSVSGDGLVTVTVEWTDSSGAQELTFVEQMTDWR